MLASEPFVRWEVHQQDTAGLECFNDAFESLVGSLGAGNVDDIEARGNVEACFRKLRFADIAYVEFDARRLLSREGNGLF